MQYVKNKIIMSKRLCACLWTFKSGVLKIQMLLVKPLRAGRIDSEVIIQRVHSFRSIISKQTFEILDIQKKNTIINMFKGLVLT